MVITEKNWNEAKSTIKGFLGMYPHLPARAYAHVTPQCLNYLEKASEAEDFEKFKRYIKGIGSFELGILETAFDLNLGIE